jgi:hypothetical protein
MTDYTDALHAITQADLDACDPALTLHRGGTFAYLKIGRMHGVSIAVEDWRDADGDVPALIRNGVVMRFLVPRGTYVTELLEGLEEGGTLSTLIDVILSGHVLSLARDGATGRLLDFAEDARDALLEALWTMGADPPPPAIETEQGWMGELDDMLCA